MGTKGGNDEEEDAIGRKGGRAGGEGGTAEGLACEGKQQSVGAGGERSAFKTADSPKVELTLVARMT